jgi:glycosyltransferase involved in cell wall biosynthesis
VRITIILGPFYPVPTALGGAVEKVQLALAKQYAALGHHVTVVSRRYRDFPETETDDGVRHVRIASRDRTPSLPINLAFDLGYELRAARALQPSDVTVTNSFFLPLLLPRKAAGKIYVHVARFPKRQMFLYRRADRLQAISSAVADAIRVQSPALASRVVMIGNPVSDAYFHPDLQRPRAKTVLYVGRIAREKGLHLLLRAFRLAAGNGRGSVKGWKLRIVGPHDPEQGGDGASYLGELRELAAPLGTACEIAGPIFDETSLIREYQSALIFAYPTVAARGEASPVAPLEAMAGGCAVVVSDLRCFDDVLQPGVNGLRFDHRSADPAGALAAELLRLMTDADLTRQMAVNGNATAGNQRTAAIASRMLEDFERLLGPGPGR